MAKITLLGAEVQAATSLAAAYPDIRFRFVSDEAVVDGWDLGNVEFLAGEAWRQDRDARTGRGPGGDDADPRTIALCPRWVPNPRHHALSAVLPALSAEFPEVLVPAERPDPAWAARIAKGDRWHKPDAPEILGGDGGDHAPAAGFEGGIVYQRFVEPRRRIAVIGRRAGPGGTAYGVFEVLEERFFREAIIQAAETVDEPAVADRSLQVLDALDYRGWFTLNWIETETDRHIVSFRPVPRAVFGAFRRGGIDLLAEPDGTLGCPEGLRLIGRPDYASYTELVR